jgi:predicted site-specific integrase-resolvase|tara:strand:+ start:514 stop:705 length:192 start_codon:yes stop_codon:yes gene_type:complete
MLKTLKELNSEKTLSEILDVSRDTLKYWRKTGKGPEFMRLENGRVRYPKEKVNEWYGRQGLGG